MYHCSRCKSSFASKWHTAAKSRRFVSRTPPINVDAQLHNEPRTPQLKSMANEGAMGTQKPTPRPFLPLSPLMDPDYLTARERYSATKASPSKKDQTPFQLQLARNPYAQALATPVRMCSVTREHLPRYFLTDFKLLAHPTTKAPYWMPDSLLSKSVPTDQSAADGEVQGQSKDGKNISISEDLPSLAESQEKEGRLSEQSAMPEDTLLDKSGPDIGSSSYILARRDILHLIQDPAGWYGPKPNMFLAPLRMRMHQDGRNILHKSIWRPDMEDFVLDLMRKDVIRHLKNTARLKRGYLIGCSSWEDALAKKQIGAFLWAGNGASESQPGFGNGNSDHPPEFATLDTGPSNRKVPVLNLRRMLGREGLGKNRIFGCEVLVLKHRNMTIDLQLKLWKLQGYLAEYRDITGTET